MKITRRKSYIKNLKKGQTDLEILFNFTKTVSKESKSLDRELQKILNDNFKKLW